MIGKTLIIKEVARFPEHGSEDRLAFLPGVNVVVGAPNTGKTKWFSMMDYLFGNDDSPEDVFGELSEKYDSAKMILEIVGEEITVERRWKVSGAKTKVFINDEPYTIKQYWHYLMERLEIPILHYPQGNPYGPRSWSELSWRSLMRHFYRRQKFWNDFADKQPESEQYACLMQFVGIAEHLFSDQFQQLVDKEKEIIRLETAKDQFISMLQEVSKEIIDEEELGVALTPQSIDAALARITSELQIIEEKRNAVISELINAAVRTNNKDGKDPEISRDEVQELGENQAELSVEQEKILISLQRTEARLQEIQEYRTLIADELSRMERAADAGSVLADIKITNCPACDRSIDKTGSSNECYLCHRPIDSEDELSNASNQRVEFELEQLRNELNETDDLIERLKQDVSRLTREREQVESKLFRIQQLLKPTRSAIASILPPEILTTDIETGRLQERYQQLQRIKLTLQRREKIADQINEITKTLADLTAAVVEHNSKIDFERAADVLTDGMNTYLNLIKNLNPKSWNQADVRCRIDEKRFNFKVGENNWTAKLGGTLTLYFLIAYHYALMSLTTRPKCHYPGFLLLDFPAELEDASSVADKENFVMEPFIDLHSEPGMEFTQVIAAGSSFEDLKGAHRIELHKIWK